jgi:sugar phosphate isomerase/epimerase
VVGGGVTGELEAFFAVLKKIGYDGTMSIEGNSDNFERDALMGLNVLRSLDEKF